MRTIRFQNVLASTLVALLATGCGGGEGGAAGGSQAAIQFPVAAADQGTISGTVTFEGTPPAAEPIDMAAEPTCADKYQSQPMTQHVVVNDNGTLANVFVHVTQGPYTSLQFPTPSDSVEIDQDGCRYHPHVMGIQTGQTLAIVNSDEILHNVNAKPTTNRGFNIVQPLKMTSTKTFSTPEIMVAVHCDVHRWMNAYIGVMDNPYFAVTDNTGSFTIDRLPAGDYELEAWHEKYGTVTANVTVTAGQAAQANFTFSAPMAENAVVPLGQPVDLHDHGDHRATDQDR